MIYVQYILAFIAVIQMFLIMTLFKRVDFHRKLHMRGAEAGAKLAMACMAMGHDVIELKKKVGSNGDQQQSSTNHQEQHSSASKHSPECAASAGANSTAGPDL